MVDEGELVGLQKDGETLNDDAGAVCHVGHGYPIGCESVARVCVRKGGDAEEDESRLHEGANEPVKKRESVEESSALSFVVELRVE